MQRLLPEGPVLVLGASGYIGSQLVPRLAAAGLTVRAAARSREALEARRWAGVEVVAADVLRPETLPAALAGIRTAYYLVHSMAAGRDFSRLDLEAARNFAAAAAAAGVQQIVYLGGLVPPDASSEHITSRRDTGIELRKGSVPVIELRAGIVVGPGSAAFEVMRDLVLHLPVMVTPRWVQAKSPPIALDDLLEYLMRLPAVPAARGKTFDAGGPEVLTYEQMMTGIARLAGHRPPHVLPVPVLSPRLSSYWLRLVTAVPTPIARALIEGLRHDFLADDAELRALVPLRLHTFREAVLATFEAEQRHAVASRWTEGAFVFRDYRRDYSYYAKRVSSSTTAPAAPADVWRVVAAIGGERRYYFANWLWALREWVDWAVGGPGRNLGRRDPDEVRVGDTIDSWRVIGVDVPRRLTLCSGMKAPGAGVLEFELEPVGGGGTRLTLTTYWHPAGVWGLLFWHMLMPVHLFVLRGLTRQIRRRAGSAARTEP